MLLIKQTITAATITFIGAVTGTKLHVNTGCIVVDDAVNLCASYSPLIVNEAVSVYACISVGSGGAASSCYWSGTIPTSWEDAYWGADNCVYSAGSGPILVGCAESTSAVPVQNPY